MWAEFCERHYGVDGFNVPMVREKDCSFRPMGLPRPSMPPSIWGTGSGGVVQPYLRMCYRFYDPQLGRHSRLSPWSNTIRAENIKVGVTSFEFPPIGATHLEIFANTLTAPLRPRFVSRIPFALSVELDWSVDTLGFEPVDEDDVPPVGTLIAALGNRLYIAGSDAKDYGGTIALENGSKDFTFTGQTYSFPGHYLIGERIMVGSFERTDTYIDMWDDVRQQGRLVDPWAEATGSYDYYLEAPRPMLRWSNFFEGGAPLPEGWSPNNMLLVPCQENDDVTGLIGWGASSPALILVFTERNIWLTTTNHDPFQRTEAEIGTLSPRTVHVGYKGLVYFVGADGQIYVFNGQTTDRASQRNQFRLEESVDTSRLDEAFSVFIPDGELDFYWLPKTGGGMLLHWYDHSTGEAFFSDLTATKGWRYWDSETSMLLVKSGDSYYLVGRQISGASTGAVLWRGRPMDRLPLGDYIVLRVNVIFDEATSDTITVKVIDEDGTVADTKNLTMIGELGRAWFRSRTGAFQIEVSSAGTDQTWKIRSIDAEVAPCRT